MRSFGVLIVFLASSVCGWGQSTQQGLEALLVNKPLYLRGLWKKDKLHFSADGTLKESSELTSPMLASVDIRKVELKGDRLVLTGRRLATVYHDGHPGLFDLIEDVHIEISHPDTGDYQPALSAILTPKLSDLAVAAPEMWRSFLTHSSPLSGVRSARPSAPETTGAGGSQSASPTVPPSREKGSVKAPIVTYAPSPELSVEARRYAVDARILVFLVVDRDGRPSHVQILKPYGLGLDEKAAEAVAKYRFKPAMQGDKPVPVEMNVEVNFKTN